MFDVTAEIESCFIEYTNTTDRQIDIHPDGHCMTAGCAWAYA